MQPAWQWDHAVKILFCTYGGCDSWHGACIRIGNPLILMMTHAHSLQSLCNFLFILPAMTSLEEQQAVERVARRLITQGYIYLASVHEPIMEDRNGIRFMPWRRECPPGFGLLTGVFVLSDVETALLATDIYPDTSVWLIQSAADKPAGLRENPRSVSLSVLSTLLTAAQPSARETQKSASLRMQSQANHGESALHARPLHPPCH